MVLLVCGCLITALGVWDYRRGAISGDAVAVDGTVSDISTVSSATRPGRKLYAPIVEFRNPMSGQMSTVQSQTHSGDRPTIGDAITIMYDPGTGSATIPEGWLRRVGVGLFGLVVAALGALSIAGVL
jgi:hypothetical protein